MLLTNSFTVPVPIERAWDTLLDVERVAPCLPGAAVESFDGTVCRGRVKVKVGPISMQYAGEITIDERDEVSHTLVMTGLGKEIRGASSATARIRASMGDEGSSTTVKVQTELDLTGKPAQFGRGIITDVSDRLIGTFARNLEHLLVADEAPQDVDARTSDSAVLADRAAATATGPDALDALALVPTPVRRTALALGGVLVGLLLARLLRRR